MGEEEKDGEKTCTTAATATTTATDMMAPPRRRLPTLTSRVVEFQLPPSEDANVHDAQLLQQQQQQQPQHQQQQPQRQQLSTPSTAPSLPQSSSFSSSRRSLHRCRSSSSMTNSSKYDSNLLSRAVSDAGRWAFGIILVEVWALSADRTYLFRPESGWWIDPVYHRQCHSNYNFNNNNEEEEQEQNRGVYSRSSFCSSCQICRLVDPNRPDYVPPRHLSPGEGLPGVLWTEAVSSASWTRSFRETLAGRILGGGGGMGGGGGGGTMVGGAGGAGGDGPLILLNLPEQDSYSHIVWRSVPQLEADPDQPWNPRLKLLASLGLGLAAAVPFNLHGVDQGIVVYMAREGVDRSRLQSESNESYLISACDLIAAAYALRGPRQDVVRDRRKELSATMYRVRKKIVLILRSRRDLKDYVEQRQKEGAAEQQSKEDGENALQQRSSCCWAVSKLSATSKRILARAHEKVATALKKARGGGSPPPPSFSWGQTLLTFVGTFVTMIVITGLSVLSVQNLGSDYGILLGPIGAFMTLLYGLTAAPASQPRNAILGQTISMIIALALTHFTRSSSMPPWLLQSLVASLAIAAMVKFGITHPPAGASAVILATMGNNGTVGWGNMAMTLVGTCLAIAIATLINNLSNKRQYPIYWWGCPEFLKIFLLDAMQGLASIVGTKKKPWCFLQAIPTQKPSSWTPNSTKKHDDDDDDGTHPAREIPKTLPPRNTQHAQETIPNEISV